jgi:hypothetical protein
LIFFVTKFILLEGFMISIQKKICTGFFALACFFVLNNDVFAALGDGDKDLTYVPIAPCRIFDTRLAGGKILGGTTRDFDVTAVTSYVSQGGEANDCNGLGSAGSIAAVAVSITALQAKGFGKLKAYPYNTPQPFASTFFYNRFLTMSDTTIVKLDQSAAAPEMTIFSSGDIHVVGDVVGYYRKPIINPVALDCVTTATTNTTVAAGSTANSTAPACASGYTQTSTNCESSTWDMPFVFFKNGVCSAKNLGSGSATIRSSRTCCRVPAQ